MTTFVSKKAPARKAITEISVIEKSEKTVEPVKLSKPEIIKVLSEKTQEPTLSKSDRDLIDSFCYGKVGVEKIQHLLK